MQEDTREELARANRLYAGNRLDEAESLLRSLLAADPAAREAREVLVMVCLRRGLHGEAEEHLRSLLKSHPGESLYVDRLATLLDSLGRGAEALGCCREYLERNPEDSDSRFNYARWLRHAGQWDEAMAQYRECLDRGIREPEEVFNSMGAMLSENRRGTDAEECFREALRLREDYLPAAYNLALSRQEAGDWPGARQWLDFVLEKDPAHTDALLRLAEGESYTDPVNPVARRLSRTLRRPDLPDRDRENVHYALGKIHDDCGAYADAFAHYRQANELSARRCGGYDRAAWEKTCADALGALEGLSASLSPVSERPLLFIVGQFRSGSTLLEQVLAAHSGIEAGGEIGFWQARAAELPPGEFLWSRPAAELEALGADYLELLDADRSRERLSAANGPVANGPAAHGPAANGPVADRPVADRPVANSPAEDGRVEETYVKKRGVEKKGVEEKGVAKTCVEKNDAALVTDKRPDNFLYIPLLGALFPAARFLHTVREPLDNTLAIYFQPLERGQTYANRLEDIAHYRGCSMDLVRACGERLPGRVLEVSYDRLVREPREEIGAVLRFLGLEWDEACLDFHAVDNRVRTASVSQVRKPLYTTSSGRWRNYRDFLSQIAGTQYPRGRH